MILAKKSLNEVETETSCEGGAPWNQMNMQVAYVYQPNPQGSHFS